MIALQLPPNVFCSALHAYLTSPSCAYFGILWLERNCRLRPSMKVLGMGQSEKNWRLLFRAAPRTPPLAQTVSMAGEVAHKTIEPLTCTNPLTDQVLSLQLVKKYQAPEIANPMFQKVRYRVYKQTGLTIPQRTTKPHKAKKQ